MHATFGEENDVQEITGDCTLYNADCLDVVEDGLCAYDSIVSDPPYGMAYQSRHSAHIGKLIINDDGVEHLQWATKLPARHSKYIFCRWNNLKHVPEPESAITWVKNNWTCGDTKHEHARQTEIILFYNGSYHFFPSGRPSDVVNFAKTQNEHHPTEKPVDLMKKVIGWTDGRILNPFMGSGSTLVAAAQLGRETIGIELDPKHFDAACRRVEEAYRKRGNYSPRIKENSFIAPQARTPHYALL